MMPSSPFTSKQGKLHYSNTSSLTNPNERNDENNSRMSSIGSGRRSSSTTANRNSPSSSSSSSSSSSTSSSSLTSSPFTPSSSSSVPFSWEMLPGVPKQISNLPNSRSYTTTLPSLPLPLPPQLRSNSGVFLAVPRKKWSSYVGNEESFVWDPFSVALAECSKGSKLVKPLAMTEIPATKMRKKTRSTGSSHQPTSDRFGFGSWEFYGSCKTTGCIVDAANTVYVPRTGRSFPAYRFDRSRVE